MSNYILLCNNIDDKEEIYHVINEAASDSYKGVIPDDQYSDPYMTKEELEGEMDKMQFFCYKKNNKIMGVMGFQQIKGVTLIRHAYVLPEWQRQGVGSSLLEYLKEKTETEYLLVGTWKAATWAIEFYRKHGFSKLSDTEKYLNKYWDISQRQIATSVVLCAKLKGDYEPL